MSNSRNVKNSQNPQRRSESHESLQTKQSYRDAQNHYNENPSSFRQSFAASERSSQPYFNTRHSTTRPPEYNRRSSRREPPPESKCSLLCSRRGVLRFAEIGTNLLVLICVAASQAVNSGYAGMGGLGAGGFSIDSAYSPFQGTELQQVRDLDIQYSQMRAPGVYGGVSFSLTLFVLTLFLLVAGAKSLYQISLKFLMAEFVMDVLACVMYIVAVGLYLHFVNQVNSTDVCKKRELAYARQGYTWMSCNVQGSDAAVAVFGLISSCLYGAGAVLCALAIKKARVLQRRQNRRQPQSQPSFKWINSQHYDAEADQPVATLV
ncbi:MARVEL domain-containing protein 3 [Erpetoichthys calabaricus]|uniref:MARVEL domain-containing protein 3 n=1 Tax=Erpetoichthys calabaricus TaxID=27687 RepID=UPI0022349E7E|nr:MARVEL domain-containing protein 3 [Erpetoichthys calabaricus]